MQLEPTRFSNESSLAVASIIVREEGVGALLRGGVPTLVGYFIQGSLKYGLFEALKPVLYDTPLPEFFGGVDGGGKLAVLITAGVCAELVASTFLCPLEAARIRSVRFGGNKVGNCELL